MSFKVFSSIFLGFFVVSSHASAFVEGSVSSEEHVPRFEPQVAIVCKSRNQFLAQHMGPDGRWTTDYQLKVTCLKDKVDILHHCKKVYPNRDITNIVEASHFYKVSNFCRVGHTKCKTSLWVKPYRCLEGSFQSDALLVPEGCLFDHIHNQTRCWQFDQWNSTADAACQSRNLSLKAFAMLLPCGIDVFSGVEFVCCPHNKVNRVSAERSSHVEEPLALPQTDHRIPHTGLPSDPAVVPTATSQEVGTRDEYFGRFDPHEEHVAFKKAEKRLEERHRDKVSKIMKEWEELEERFQDLQNKDPIGAEEFKHRMTQRFQQTVQAVEAENEAEKHQLTALHQQRIVAHINEMKREAMMCYTKALGTHLPNTHKVQKCLEKLLKALNKDRHHTVSHFKHLLNSDYEAADRERDSTLQHLTDLDKMVNQSLNMLTRHPDLYGKIGRLMHEYAAALRSKDTTPVELTPQTPLAKASSDEYSDSIDSLIDNTYNAQQMQEDVFATSSSDRDSPAAVNNEDAALLPPSGTSLPSSSSQKTQVEHASDASTSEDITASSDSSPVVHTVEEPRVAHAQHHSFSHAQSSYSVTREHSASESRGVYFTLAFAGVALMGAMVVGIVVLRRRNSTSPHNQGFMEVDQAATPEERHVANMQVNGYENPTYKYFEEK